MSERRLIGGLVALVLLCSEPIAAQENSDAYLRNVVSELRLMNELPTLGVQDRLATAASTSASKHEEHRHRQKLQQQQQQQQRQQQQLKSQQVILKAYLIAARDNVKIDVTAVALIDRSSI
jgi:cell shape-determining protein MreC